mmetsp:Transcript_23920/g.45916  ORF Transcript_23920/g.45916 Transcript_23920/m.45916 type:complete len:148 (-) Transcript_23920:387-830(-)
MSGKRLQQGFRLMLLCWQCHRYCNRYLLLQSEKLPHISGAAKDASVSCPFSLLPRWQTEQTRCPRMVTALGTCVSKKLSPMNVSELEQLCLRSNGWSKCDLKGEQVLQTQHPQARQWCLRLNHVNFVEHISQASELGLHSKSPIPSL